MKRVEREQVVWPHWNASGVCRQGHIGAAMVLGLATCGRACDYNQDEQGVPDAQNWHSFIRRHILRTLNLLLLYILT